MQKLIVSTTNILNTIFVLGPLGSLEAINFDVRRIYHVIETANVVTMIYESNLNNPYFDS